MPRAICAQCDAWLELEMTGGRVDEITLNKSELFCQVASDKRRGKGSGFDYSACPGMVAAIGEVVRAAARPAVRSSDEAGSSYHSM